MHMMTTLHHSHALRRYFNAHANVEDEERKTQLIPGEREVPGLWQELQRCCPEGAHKDVLWGSLRKAPEVEEPESPQLEEQEPEP